MSTTSESGLANQPHSQEETRTGFLDSPIVLNRAPRMPRAIALFLALSALACRDTGSESIATATTAPAEVRAVVGGLIAADNAGDLEAVMRHYGSNPVLMPPGREAIRGRAAVRNHYAALLESTEMELECESVETVIAGDWAFDRGFTFGRITPAGGDTEALRDRYLMLLQRDPAGTWKVERLIWHPGPPERIGGEDGQSR